MIQDPRADERSRLLDIAVNTGLFDSDSAAALLGGILDAKHDGALDSSHRVRVWRAASDANASGWTYAAPDAHAPDIWNLWWIGVDPSAHGAGIGTALLRDIESLAQAAGARLLVIETSALPATARARRFYLREGYEACGRIPDFYADGDDKIVFARRLVPAVAPPG
jgi:ribosomal protein S18 acetylase RimI-like enzyme